MSDDHIGVKVNGVIYVKLEDARKLREGWDKADDRIAELEAALNEITARLLSTFPGLKDLPPIQKVLGALEEGKDD